MYSDGRVRRRVLIWDRSTSRIICPRRRRGRFKGGLWRRRWWRRIRSRRNCRCAENACITKTTQTKWQRFFEYAISHASLRVRKSYYYLQALFFHLQLLVPQRSVSRHSVTDENELQISARFCLHITICMSSIGKRTKNHHLYSESDTCLSNRDSEVKPHPKLHLQITQRSWL